jgi:hypothetical protein
MQHSASGFNGPPVSKWNKYLLASVQCYKATVNGHGFIMPGAFKRKAKFAKQIKTLKFI